MDQSEKKEITNYAVQSEGFLLPSHSRGSWPGWLLPGAESWWWRSRSRHWPNQTSSQIVYLRNNKNIIYRFLGSSRFTKKYYNWTLTWSWGNMFTNSGFRLVTQGSKADTLQCHQQYNKWVTILAKMFTVPQKHWKKHVYMALTTHSKWIYWYENPKNILIPNTVVLYCNRITNYENVVFVTKIF